jgi:hypothetical protein
VNRSDFQELAELHLQHAKALLDAQVYSGAYYIPYDFPDKRVTTSAWTHDLVELARVSGLKPDFDAAKRGDDMLGANWQTVDGWSESSRYENHLQHEAESLFTAVSDPNHGVRACI